MNADNFAEWLRRRGRLVVRTASSYWHSEGVRALQAFPYHWTIHPSEDELTQLLKTSRALSLRYSTSTDAPLGYLSYHTILETGRYEIENLGKWARKNVRRGLRNCSVEPISFRDLAEKGWDLQCDTLARQGRSRKLTREDWTELCLAASGLPGFEAWGGMVEGKLAASVITFLMQDCCYMLYQQCRHEYLTSHVNNALGFAVTQALLHRDGVRSVFYSLHSLDAPSSVDEFKFRLGFSPRPVRQRVVFHPLCAPFINPITHAFVRAAKALRPGSPFFAKTEGMVRFYIEGKKSVSQQMRHASFLQLEAARASLANSERAKAAH
jgi:hypothetical protein